MSRKRGDRFHMPGGNPLRSSAFIMGAGGRNFNIEKETALLFHEIIFALSKV